MARAGQHGAGWAQAERELLGAVVAGEVGWRPADPTERPRGGVLGVRDVYYRELHVH